MEGFLPLLLLSKMKLLITGKSSHLNMELQSSFPLIFLQLKNCRAWLKSLWPIQPTKLWHRVEMWARAIWDGDFTKCGGFFHISCFQTCDNCQAVKDQRLVYLTSVNTQNSSQLSTCPTVFSSKIFQETHKTATTKYVMQPASKWKASQILIFQKTVFSLLRPRVLSTP